MSDKKLIAPSMLAADFSNLAHDIALVNQSDADWFHLDVMDGVFVPNISFGMPVIKSMAKHTSKPLDVHLMIVEPDRYIQTFADLGADVLVRLSFRPKKIIDGLQQKLDAFKRM